MMFDYRYLIFALPALLLALYAQAKVKSAYNKYSRQPNARGITGLEAAHILLRSAGLGHVRIEQTSGTLTDHYEPGKDILRLSAGVASVPSVAALGIVAHEIGHATQDAAGYLPLRLRAGLVPIVNIGSWLGPIVFMAGLFLSTTVAWVGLFLFAGTALFSLVTLPVELNASRRAQQMLYDYQLTDGQELQQVKKVLNAAALTYVAAVAQSLSTLLYYFFILTGGRRRD
jgi:Zn-dependent membrane protease YugP